MQLENEFCRKPLAASFNKLPGHVWIPNPNVVYTANAKFGEGAKYESGRPDAFVFRMFSTPLCIECKAGIRRFYMGNPEEKTQTKGWSCAQRNWYNKVAKASATPYYIAVFLADTIDSTAEGNLYLVPAAKYLETEKQLLATTGSRYLPYRKDSDKIFIVCAENEWEPYLVSRLGKEWMVQPTKL